MNPVEGLECDHLETEDDFILTRCGQGQAILVWRQLPMKEDLALIDEITQDIPEDEILDFKMRGSITERFNNGVKYNLVLMVTSTPEVYLVNALKQRPLSE